MSPEQAAGEREIDGRSDLYSLGVVTYQMLTGELPFNAPTVAGILMKQITEPAPDIRDAPPDVPEDLSLAVSRCLEKDPENRWPTADALRRALESRTVTGYRPTGTSSRASALEAPRPTRGRSRAAGLARGTSVAGAPRRPAAGARAAPAAGTAGRPRGPAAATTASGTRSDLPVPDTGEPKIVQKVRGQFASWAAVSLGCLGINVATGITDPWFLFPDVGMGIGLLRNYAKLWQAGYSWRDVLTPARRRRTRSRRPW